MRPGAGPSAVKAFGLSASGALVSNPELKTAIADASVTAGRARQIVEHAEKPVNQLLADMPQATESLNRLVKRLDSVANDLPQTSADFHAALALYESRLDKDYSLTDCRSMVALRALGISEVLTNDHHFTQEGFTI